MRGCFILVETKTDFMKCIKAVLETIGDSELEDLVRRLNTQPLYCRKHPDFETVLVVSTSSKEGIVRVEKVCCQDFQNQLIDLKLISQ